ncbi:ankyrin, partial [Tothia fuscella]
PLHHATKAGNREAVTVLLSHGADPAIPDYTTTTPLHYAAENSHFSLLSAMLPRSTRLVQLQDGAKSMAFDQRDSVGQTPLHIACQRKEQEMVDLLLTSGADPSITNHRGESALDVALRKHETEIADILVKAGAT